jgi:methionyl-tRNA formyltransferase
VSEVLRVAFLGNDRWSVPSLEALARSEHEIVAVVTSVPKPAGRGNELRPTWVARAGRRLSSTLFEVETVARGPGLGLLEASKPDVLAVVAYGELLPPTVLELPKVSPVNLHFSLLPELRGATPVQTALLRGLERTGVTTIVMDRGLDTGPVLEQRAEAIRPDDDARALGDRLAALGAEVLVSTIDALAAGSARPTPQDGSRATFAPRLGPRDRVLDWSEPAEALVNRIRALSPEPAATTTFRGEGLKVLRAEEVDAAPGAPGAVVEVDKDRFVVAAGRGGLRPVEVAPAGRRRMAASDFVHGYRPRIGERLE